MKSVEPVKHVEAAVDKSESESEEGSGSSSDEEEDSEVEDDLTPFERVQRRIEVSLPLLIFSSVMEYYALLLIRIVAGAMKLNDLRTH